MIWPCERRTKGLLATVRDCRVAARDEPYAENRARLPRAFVVRSQRVGQVRHFSDSLATKDSSGAAVRRRC
jgi:hypothetical protein